MRKTEPQTMYITGSLLSQISLHLYAVGFADGFLIELLEL